MSNSRSPDTTIIDQWMTVLENSLFDIGRPENTAQIDSVKDISYHDFGSYAFVLDPWDNRERAADDDLASEVGPEAANGGGATGEFSTPFLEPLDDAAKTFIDVFIDEARQLSADPAQFDQTSILVILDRFVRIVMHGRPDKGERGLIGLYGDLQGIAIRRYQMLIHFMEADAGLAAVVDDYERMSEFQRVKFLNNYFDIAVAQWVERSAQFDKPWTCPADLLPTVIMHQSGSTVVAYDLTVPSTWTAAGYLRQDHFQASQYITSSATTWDNNNPDAVLIAIKERDELAHQIAWRSSVYDDGSRPYPNRIGEGDDGRFFWPPSHGNINSQVAPAHCNIAFAYDGRLAGTNPNFCQLICEIADRIIAEEPPAHEQETEEIVSWLDNITAGLSESLALGGRESISPDATAGGIIGTAVSATQDAAGAITTTETQASQASPQTGRYDRYERAYGFRPYPFPSINLGLQVVYRQEWDRKAIAKGDLVKTIPLGPGQSEKIVLKQLERNKVTRKLEEVDKYERATESSLKTTNSSEVVEEAARTSKWSLNIDFSAEASGKADFLVAGGEFSTKLQTQTNIENSSSFNSRSSKKKLAEAMQRASAKLNRERRVSVDTEREVVQEETRTSEIKNTNDTMAVTYYYYTIQQQYEVHTFLASVEPVLFISEELPDPDLLTIQWVRRYDWILRGALLDESFAEVLTELRTLDVDEVKAEVQDAREKVRTLSSALSAAATASLNDVGDPNISPKLADTYEGVLRAYLDATREARDLAREYQGILSQARRLGMHLGDNILHYCRAIWSIEDPERRRMRYAEQTWPSRFKTETVPPSEAEPDGSWLWGGRFRPDPASYVPLSDLIDPTGPLGFAGNYAVFRMPRTSVTAGFSPLLWQVAQPYFTEPTFTTSNEKVLAEVINRDLYLGFDYAVTRIGDDTSDTNSYTVSRVFLEKDELINAPNEVEIHFGDENAEHVMTVILPLDGVAIRFSVFTPKDEKVRIDLDDVALQDPELLYLQKLYPDLDLEAPRPTDAEPTCDNPRSIMEALECANTRDVLIDTQNLHLEIDPSPLLEPFKQYHRMLDVAMVALEVERRRKRLAAGLYDDPDVDKNIRVEGTAKSSD